LKRVSSKSDRLDHGESDVFPFDLPASLGSDRIPAAKKPGKGKELLQLTFRCGSSTFADMKDAVLTIRLPLAARRRIEELARREGRSLSAEAERLIDCGMAKDASRTRTSRPLSGALAGGAVPTLADFRRIRAVLSASARRSGGRGQPRR
jgi:hypothetical protein